MRQLAKPRRTAIDDAPRRGCIGIARRTVAGRVAGHGDAAANIDANAVEVAGIISLVDVQERRQRRPGRGRVPRCASRLSDVMLVLERDAQDAPVFPARFEPALDDAHAGVILRQHIATLGKVLESEVLSATQRRAGSNRYFAPAVIISSGRHDIESQPLFDV